MVREEGQEGAGSQRERREEGTERSPKWQEVMENFETLHSVSLKRGANGGGTGAKGDNTKTNMYVYSDTKVFDL